MLFGGVSAPPGPNQPQTFFSDTWLWDGKSWQKAADGGPRGRYAHGMVFDERAGVVLLYSGSAAHSDAPLSDMWQWDGSRWTEIRLEGPTPGHRYQPVMVYDRARDRTVLYGGIGGTNDTWEWDGRAVAAAGQAVMTAPRALTPHLEYHRAAGRAARPCHQGLSRRGRTSCAVIHHTPSIARPVRGSGLRRGRAAGADAAPAIQPRRRHRHTGPSGLDLSAWRSR